MIFDVDRGGLVLVLRALFSFVVVNVGVEPLEPLAVLVDQLAELDLGGNSWVSVRIKSSASPLIGAEFGFNPFLEPAINNAIAISEVP